MRIEFEGIISGDNECFCWDVTEEQYRKIVGEEKYLKDLEIEESIAEEHKKLGILNFKEEGTKVWRIYPNDLLYALLGESSYSMKQDKRKFSLEVLEDRRK
jgi:hypothetical protein